MERNVSMEEISDGKLYGLNDMVKADCQDCKGCSACCRGMGTSIVLDPLDIYRLTVHLGRSFEELLAAGVELNLADGLILPNLGMKGEEERCAFLDENGRCSIHPYRPGICRLFPLGRFYEDGGFRYFLQTNECRKENRTKVKVRKWIDTPDIRQYEQFVSDWHYFLKKLQNAVKEKPDEGAVKKISMYILKQFYMLPYEAEHDFYGQFYQRFEAAGEFSEQFLESLYAE